MKLDAVFLTTDGTLLSRPVAISGVYSHHEHPDDGVDDCDVLHEPLGFYLDDESGSLVYVGSVHAHASVGEFIGYVRSGSDPETLRAVAEKCGECGSPRPGMAAN